MTGIDLSKISTEELKDELVRRQNYAKANNQLARIKEVFQTLEEMGYTIENINDPNYVLDYKYMTVSHKEKKVYYSESYSESYVKANLGDDE